jgi:hypothetical protein
MEFALPKGQLFWRQDAINAVVLDDCKFERPALWLNALVARDEDVGPSPSVGNLHDAKRRGIVQIKGCSGLRPNHIA